LKIQTAVCLAALFGGSLAFAAGNGQSGIYVTTQHNDLSRSGLNPVETTLTVTAVKGTDPNHRLGFGKLFTLTLFHTGSDAEQIYSQPLYVGGVTVAGTTHNVLYVTSQLNNVYAFDADEAGSALGGNLTGGALWQVNLGTPIQCSWYSTGCAVGITPYIGILSTPVIDVGKNVIYVVAETAIGTTNSQFKLHALDLSTGAERYGGPTVIAGSVTSTAIDSVGGILTFNAWQHLQRPGLLLLNGTIYIGFGSHADTQYYHGWVFGYDEKTLRLTAIKCLTPDAWNAGGGAVWQGGGGLSADSANNIYVTTGNGDLNASTGGHDYGQSVIKLNAMAGLKEEDYFAPGDWTTTNNADLDLGSAGALVIPGTSPPLILVGGKTGIMYLVDSANMGEYAANADNIAQQVSTSWNMGAGHVFFNSTLYQWGRYSPMKSYSFNFANAVPPYTTGPMSTSPTHSTSVGAPDGPYTNEPAMSASAHAPCPIITVSCSTAPTTGTGIIWATYSQSSSNGGAYPANFQAFDASSLGAPIWDWTTSSNPSANNPGNWAKWCPPTVANGKVYVASFDGVVSVYGLLD
jgi:hypothetical protein